MKIKIRSYELDSNMILSIAVGTAAGTFVYWVFMYLSIDIFGWNLGLIFAPLAAGYVETIVARRLVGEGIGAISAFILFIDTTIYSFILRNPTLGANFITAGAIVVILQAAFPTLINYILLVVVGGFISGFANKIKNAEKKIIYRIKHQTFFRWKAEDVKTPDNAVPAFNENKSNIKLNSLDFYFLTGTDMTLRSYETLGIYEYDVLIDKNIKIIKLNPEQLEEEQLKNIKEGKDKCLINLVDKVKKAGGNGIIDLTITYFSAGSGGDKIQITACGVGIKT